MPPSSPIPLAVALAVAFTFACSSSGASAQGDATADTQLCAPGEQTRDGCPNPPGEYEYRVCADDGLSWSTCFIVEPPVDSAVGPSDSPDAHDAHDASAAPDGADDAPSEASAPADAADSG